MFDIRNMFDLAGPSSINFGLREPDLDLSLMEAIDSMNAVMTADTTSIGPSRHLRAEECHCRLLLSLYERLEGGNIMVMPNVSIALLKVA